MSSHRYFLDLFNCFSMILKHEVVLHLLYSSKLKNHFVARYGTTIYQELIRNVSISHLIIERSITNLYASAVIFSTANVFKLFKSRVAVIVNHLFEEHEIGQTVKSLRCFSGNHPNKSANYPLLSVTFVIITSEVIKVFSEIVPNHTNTEDGLLLTHRRGGKAIPPRLKYKPWLANVRSKNKKAEFLKFLENLLHFRSLINF
ncbi:hypothetical protein EGR_04579 [Echinococcus granulosus]|uniref:Uncharacterized protein n=1 Tax=Echinococcus granulosus TaxID=6210 RepID=W6UGD5_ECHGR|nr:hypothetical protein EGR_04579 [Echinococcus granulosus]EUB60560.1 hypothetical protein EGR_04579 [Echinococcus granulosus]